MRLSYGSLVLALVATAACHGGDATSAAPSLGIAPGAVYLTPGDSITLSAQRSGNTEVNVSWSSADTSIVVVTQSGGAAAMLRAKKIGLTTVTVSKGGEQASVPVSVVAPAVSHIAINPAGPTTHIDGRVQLTAEVRNAEGVLLTNRHVGWASNNTVIATIDDNGVVLGRQIGSAIITAYSEGQQASTIVYVTQAVVATVILRPSPAIVARYDSVQMRAIPLDVHLDTLQGLATWYSSDTTIAKVGANGVVYGRKEGTTTILGQIDDKVGTATITVGPARATSLDVSIVTSLSKYEQSQIVLHVRDVMGNELFGRTVVYSSDNGASVTVSSSGLLTAVEQGAARITIDCEGVHRQYSVAVMPPLAASVTLSPSSATMTEGDTLRVLPTAIDSHGNPILSGKVFTFASTLPADVRVDENGLVTVVNYHPGSATIRVTCDGQTANATINLIPPPVSFLTISPAQATVSAGSRIVVSATAYDSQGRPLPTAPIAYVSNDGRLATVDALGVVQTDPQHLGSVGQVTITASSGGKSIPAVITIIP
ncbi:MAG: Ig-like domain-containing protein [Gemmatimonadota bacterium]|nr:Ig-like domain-containing protein [Gemmatimonadota bacterium]